ncbi:hypothetical protein J6590_079423 [Homalodisca vitripennis]|nr:hypothetical protein J6590_079423 [Homalodisca vitripennis]
MMYQLEVNITVNNAADKGCIVTDKLFSGKKEKVGREENKALIKPHNEADCSKWSLNVAVGLELGESFSNVVDKKQH